MSGLFLANTLIARFPGTIDRALLLGGIFLVEPLVLWLFFNKFLKIKINFPSLILVSLLANFVSSLLGFFLGGLTVFNTSMGPYIPFILYIRPLNRSGLVGNLTLLGFAFAISAILEWLFYKYRGFQKLEKKVRNNSLKASVLANLASYILLVFYLIYISIWVPEESYAIARYQIRPYFDRILRAQQEFYLERSHFASSLTELNQGLEADLTEYYWYNIGVADKEKATITAIHKNDPRSRSGGLRNYIGVVFVVDQNNQDKPEFRAAICRSDRVSMTAPQIPKLVKVKIICPPGYSRFDRYQQQGKS